MFEQVSSSWVGLRPEALLSTKLSAVCIAAGMCFVAAVHMMRVTGTFCKIIRVGQNHIYTVYIYGFGWPTLKIMVP